MVYKELRQSKKKKADEQRQNWVKDLNKALTEEEIEMASKNIKGYLTSLAML